MKGENDHTIIREKYHKIFTNIRGFHNRIEKCDDGDNITMMIIKMTRTRRLQQSCISANNTLLLT